MCLLMLCVFSFMTGPVVYLCIYFGFRCSHYDEECIVKNVSLQVFSYKNANTLTYYNIVAIR